MKPTERLLRQQRKDMTETRLRYPLSFFSATHLLVGDDNKAYKATEMYF